MVNYFKFIFLFLLIKYSFSEITYDIDESNNTIKISYNDVILFDHSTSSPIVSVGFGEATFVDSLGSFDITDEILYKDDLTYYAIITANATYTEIHFRKNDDDTDGFQAVFTLREMSTESGVDHLHYEIYSIGNGTEYNRIFFVLVGEKDEGVGRIVNDSNTNSGSVGSYYTTYWPQASYLSDRYYSLILSNYEYSELNFESPEQNLIYVHSNYVTGDILQENEMIPLVSKISKFIGLQQRLPEWILKGAVIAFEGGTDEVMPLYNQVKESGVDVSAIWIQDWSGKIRTGFGYRVYWNWKLDDTFYTDFDSHIKNLTEDGVNVMVYCNPYLIEGSELFQIADRNGYFLKTSSGETYLQDFGGFSAGTIDLYSQEANQWYTETLRNNTIKIGIKGWMADFGEYTDLDMFSSSTIEPEVLHNKLPFVWADTNRNIVGDSNEDVVYFMRSGSRGSSSRQMLNWAGDQNVDFSIADGVASTIVASLSLSVSGMGLTHFDIGGYTTQTPVLTRSEELLLRSAEYAVFTPVMRTHLGNEPNANVQVYDSPELLSKFSRLTKIHSRLYNYTKSLLDLNLNEGIPVLRPVLLHYPNNAEVKDLKTQYMFGSDVIVAPVIHKGQTIVSVFIPGGDDSEWLSFWPKVSNETYFGPQTYDVDAPIGYPAAFYRKDSSYSDLFRSISDDFGIL
ncbi:Sulfoquinovosidase [Armadillidium nasatum]|uniref:Sulfoquinovosidase n=1 Tax=Armadillidium nasatum TaxID=96803 RepID=A0A5N5T1R1_9CRUS|nr:Sulfoquinovosidase [Armadillidium nasatum]